MTDGWTPVLAFDRDSPDFALGVEVGRLWEMLRQPDGFEQPIHAENVEMVARMFETAGSDGGPLPREMRIEDTVDEAWCVLVVAPWSLAG